MLAMKKIVIVFVAWLLASLFGLGVCVCDDSSTSETGTLEEVCYKLFQGLQDALYADKGNTYRLRKAFFYAPNAHTVLMKVVYNVTFAANITSIIDHDYCDNTSSVRMKLSPNETAVIYGWTSNGIFTVVHPLVLNFMQIQLPFVLLRIFYYVLESDRGPGPEAQTFLWDGTYDLPTLQINLLITTLPCIPNENIFMSALKDFNSLLRVYAGTPRSYDHPLKDSGNTHLVGFSLPKSSVSAHEFRDESYTPFYLVYVLSSIVLYVLCVTTALFVVSKSRNDMKTFTQNNTDVLIGLTAVMSVFIIMEVITEIIMAIVWSNAVKDPIITLYVVLSTVLYCFPGIVSVCNMVREMRNQRKPQKKEDDNTERQTANEPDAITKTEKKSITSLPLYSFIWLASYFFYLLLYAFFPAFILAFAYPIRVISIFVFMATFMVLSTVSVITYIRRRVKLFPFASKLEKGTQQALHLISKVIVGCFIALNFLYFFLFVFGLLYSLIIGKASVVSSAPLALLSLLPSILVSAMAWVIKKTVLDNGSKSDEEKKNVDTNESRSDEQQTNTKDSTTAIGDRSDEEQKTTKDTTTATRATFPAQLEIH